MCGVLNFVISLRSNKIGRKGQTLVEALVALSVLTAGFLGILTLLSQSTALTRVVNDRYTATYLAAEGIEIIKNLVDANIIQGNRWNAGFSRPFGIYEVQYDDQVLTRSENRFLNFDPVDHLYGYGNGIPTSFKRQVFVVVPSDEMIVYSRVTWTGRWTGMGGTPSRVSAEAHFYNWRR